MAKNATFVFYQFHMSLYRFRYLFILFQFPQFVLLFSLSISVLYLRSPSLFGAGLSLPITNVVAGPELMILMTARHSSAINIRTLWKKKKDLLLTCPEDYMVHLGPHREVEGRGKENVCVGGGGTWSSVVWGSRIGPMVLGAQSIHEFNT